MGPGEPGDDPYERPPGVDDATVSAVGRVSEALEWVERARGRLYDFHQLIGRADLILGEALDELEAAGWGDRADRIRTHVLGRNVLAGRWTFQIVDEFDDGYYRAFREAEAGLREQALDGRRHVHEAEMKERRRTGGRPGHEARPPP